MCLRNFCCCCASWIMTLPCCACCVWISCIRGCCDCCQALFRSCCDLSWAPSIGPSRVCRADGFFPIQHQGGFATGWRIHRFDSMPSASGRLWRLRPDFDALPAYGLGIHWRAGADSRLVASQSHLLPFERIFPGDRPPACRRLRSGDAHLDNGSFLTADLRW